MWLSVILVWLMFGKNIKFDGFLTRITNNLTNEQELPYL